MKTTPVICLLAAMMFSARVYSHEISTHQQITIRAVEYLTITDPNRPIDPNLSSILQIGSVN
jgi:hypothetical protein